MAIGGIGHRIAGIFGRARRNTHAGDDKIALAELGLRHRSPSGRGAIGRLDVSSTAFADGAPIPTRYTKDGAGLSPPLHIDRVPRTAKELAIVVEDPDAPRTSPFVHWVAYHIAPDMLDLDEGAGNRAESFVQARNTAFREEYAPPAPPLGHGTHHYHFQVFALDQRLEVPKHATRDDLVLQMRGHVLAYGDLVGTFERA